jgi:hypothetical protein
MACERPRISGKSAKEFLTEALIEVESEGFSELPPMIQETFLEKWARRALPNGTSGQREEIKSRWRREMPVRDMIKKLERAQKRLEQGLAAPCRTMRRSKPTRRNRRYERIDERLKAIAESRPRSHQEVFEALERGHIRLPHAEPFEGTGGWLTGFKRDPKRARSWLSKAWTRLHLPAFPRGPKKSKSYRNCSR